jgi:hypothetical protein
MVIHGHHTREGVVALDGICERLLGFEIVAWLSCVGMTVDRRLLIRNISLGQKYPTVVLGAMTVDVTFLSRV